MAIIHKITIEAPGGVSGLRLGLPLQVARVRITVDTNEELEEPISGDRNLFFDVVRIPQ